MSSLNIYYQCAAGLKGQKLQDFKRTCSQSDFDVVCITMSSLTNKNADQEVVDTDIFDIFRLDYEHNVKKNYRLWGTFIAVRKHLSAFIRTEWETEGVDCVWITIPPRGCSSCLHVACVNFYESLDIDAYTGTLVSLSESHSSDQFLVLEQFPFYDREATKLQISSINGPGNKVIRRLYVGTTLAGLGQCNNIKEKGEVLHCLVFSSVHVTVLHCRQPLVPENKKWQKALQFELNISPHECCKTKNDTAEYNCRSAPRDQREAQRDQCKSPKDKCKSCQNNADTSADINESIDGLLQPKLNDFTKLLHKLVDEKVEQSVNEDLSATPTYKNLHVRIEQLEGDSKQLANIEARLKILEDNSKQFANIEEGLETLEEKALSLWGRKFGGQQTTGTVVNFAPLVIVQGDQSQPINMTYNCTIPVKEFEKSLEEDYEGDRKGPQTDAEPGPVGAPSETSTIEAPATYNFGRSTGFGQPTTTSFTGIFGTTTTIGSTLSTGIFGNTATKSASAFGATSSGANTFTFVPSEPARSSSTATQAPLETPTHRQSNQ